MLLKRKTILGLMAGIFLIFLQTQGVPWFWIGSAHAAQQTLNFQDAITTVMGTGLGIAITFFHFLIYICLLLVGVLLDPTFMDLGQKDGMAQILLKIWQISRNLTNIILAFLLIIGGIITVVRAGDTFVKQYATKFVVAVILVNFSWFFPRVLIDLSNILTATVYALPSAIDTECVAFDLEGKKDNGGCKYISKFSLGEAKSGDGWECPIPIADTLCVKYDDLSKDANHPNAIIGGIIVNYGRLRYLHRVTGIGESTSPIAGATSWDRVPQQITYLLQAGMVLFFSIMLLFPLMAMVAVFLIRIPVIWVTVAFMPFMFLGYVAGDLLQFNLWKEIFVRFLKATFLPTVVAIPFAIGFIMLNSAMSTPPPGIAEALNSVTAKMPILPGVSNLWQLLWTAMSMLIIWYGAFKALSFDEDFNFIVKPLENAGKNVGKFAVQLPLLLPLPMPGVAGPGGEVKKGPSIKQMLGVASDPMRFAAPGGKLDLNNLWDRMSGNQNVNMNASNKLAAHINIQNNIESERYGARLNDAITAVNSATPATAKTATDALKNLIREKDSNWNGNSSDLKQLIDDLKTKVTRIRINDLTPSKAKD